MSTSSEALTRQTAETAPGVSVALLSAFAEAFMVCQPRSDALAWLRMVTVILTDRAAGRSPNVVPLVAANDAQDPGDAEAASALFREVILPKCVERVKASPRR